MSLIAYKFVLHYLIASVILGMGFNLEVAAMPRGVRINQDELVWLWESGYGSEEISETIGIGQGAVLRNLRERGIWQRNRTPLSGSEKKKILTDYRNGVPGMKIAIQIGREFKWVYRFLEEAGVKRRNPSDAKRKWKLDQDVFEDAEHFPEAAYWVGFLMADGSIGVGGETSGTVRLRLHEKDADQIEKFRKFLGTDKPVSYELGRGFSKPGSRLVGLGITSRKMVNDLSTYGVVPRKSKTAEVKVLESNRHFWRGMVDGDGWIFVRKDGLPVIGLTGSLNIVKQFVSFVASTSGKTPSINPNHSIWRAAVSGKVAVALVKVLYGNCGMALTRKLSTATRIIKEISYIPSPV
jgi:hypothetical protein